MKSWHISWALGIILFLPPLLNAQQLTAPASPPFTFTKVDTELLEQSNWADREFQDKGRVYDDRETTEYVTAVGQAVLPEGTKPEGVHWRFFVLRDPQPNAFALPNGSIYVHTGLLALLENEAQLAAVLAHEEAHVLNRHGYLENRSLRKKTATANVLWSVASSIAQNERGKVGAGAILVYGGLVCIVNSTVNGYSRELEREADLQAVHAIVDADYSPEEMVNLFRVLLRSHEAEAAEDFYQDHPKLHERIAYVRDLANSLRPWSAHPKVEADRYLLESKSAIRHDMDLEISSGRVRTAVWVMEHVIERDNKLADNFYELGEAYRGLGPHPPEPTPEELSRRCKTVECKKMSRISQEQYEEALLKTPEGHAAWKANQEKSETAYQKAIELSPDYAAPHRGLGFLYERAHQAKLSAREFRQYLELAPTALDTAQIKQHIGVMEEAASASPSSVSN
jgi:predicted Zn-dependent protease